MDKVMIGLKVQVCMNGIFSHCQMILHKQNQYIYSMKTLHVPSLHVLFQLNNMQSLLIINR